MKSKFLVLLSILAVMCWVSAAQATATLTLFDFGANFVQVNDNGVGDINPLVGVITYSTGIVPFGVWNVNVTTGLSESPIAHMDLNSIDNSTGAGSLAITFSDTGFAPPVTAAVMAIGGTQDSGHVDFETNFGSILGITGTPFAASLTGTIPGGVTGMFEEVIITHTAAGHTSFDASLETVPVPPSAILLGSGLLGLVGLGWRRRKP